MPISRFPRSDWLGSSTSPPLITRSNLSSGPMAASADPPSVAAATASANAPVETSKSRRDRADITSSSSRLSLVEAGCHQADCKSEVCSIHTHAQAGSASYRARPQNHRSRIEVKRRSESLQEIYPKNPINPQPGRKSYDEDFKRLDNDPFDLQALKTKARHFNVHPLDTSSGTSRHRTTQI